MFDAELQAIGTILQAVLNQGGLFFSTYIADLNTPETKWYMLLFSAAIVYSFVEGIVFRRKYK